MKNKELFNLNPDENNLINDGVVEINTSRIEEKGLHTISPISTISIITTISPIITSIIITHR